jgi:thioredoxin reductase (NADPH)
MKSLVCCIVAIIFVHSVTACEKPKISGCIIPREQNFQEAKVFPIVVIGSGAAGTMAVKRAVLNNDEVLLFLGTGPQLRHARGRWVKKVDNIPGLEKYQRTILELRDEVLQDLMQSPLAHNLFVSDESVCSIEKEGDLFKIWDSQGRIYYASYVVLATGIMNEQPKIQGSIRPILPYANSQAIGYCVVCDGHRSFRKKTVVIGHLESAAYTALRLSEMYQLPQIVILTNGYAPEFSGELLKHLQNRNIEIMQAPILEVIGNEELRLLSGFRLETGTVVEAEAGFICLGIIPNNQLALQLNAQLDAEGLVITDNYGESSVPNLFVAGDLRSDGMMQIYSAWQNAVDSVQEINWRIRKKL